MRCRSGAADGLLGGLPPRAESAATGGPTGDWRRGDPKAPGGGAPAARRGRGMTRTIAVVVLFSLTLALLAAPLAVEPQQRGKVYRIALMDPAAATDMTEAKNLNY